MRHPHLPISSYPHILVSPSPHLRVSAIVFSPYFYLFDNGNRNSIFIKTEVEVRLKKEYFLLVFIILPFLILLLTFQTHAQIPEGESLFKLNCSPCHTVGQGKLVGPDLARIEERRDREWIRTFIRSSQSVIQSGDPAAVAIYNEFNQILMPDQATLTEKEINSILVFIKNTSQTARPQATVTLKSIQEEDSGQNKKPSDSPVSPLGDQDEEVIKGRELFLGMVRLKAGGPSCNSCHNVTEEEKPEGGTFAPDLTNVYSRIDEKEIMELATAPKYPSMQKVYHDKPITPEEAYLLASFLKYAGTGSEYQQKRDQRAADLLKRFNRNGQE
jgi:cytochrome c2